MRARAARARLRTFLLHLNQKPDKFWKGGEFPSRLHLVLVGECFLIIGCPQLLVALPPGPLHTLGHSLGHSLKNAQTEKWAIFARVEPFCLRSPKFRDFCPKCSKWRHCEKIQKTRQSQRQKHCVLLEKKLCPKFHNVTFESRPKIGHFWPLFHKK